MFPIVFCSVAVAWAEPPASRPASTAAFSATNYRLYHYQPRKGDTYVVRVKEDQSMITSTAEGKVIQRRQMQNEAVYEEKVLAVQEGRISERMRVYRRCAAHYLIVRGNRQRALPWSCGLVGRTLILKGVRGRDVTIATQDQRPLSARDRNYVRRSLSRRSQRRLFPQMPLPIGGIWKIPTDALLQQVPFPRQTIDIKGIRAEGKLLAIQADSAPLRATLQMDLLIPLIAFPRYEQVKGQIILSSKGSGAVDGRSPFLDNIATSTIHFEGVARFQRGKLATKTLIRSKNHRRVTPK